VNIARRRQPGQVRARESPLVGDPVPEQLDGLAGRLAGQPASAVLVQGDGPDAGAAFRRSAVQLPGQRDELPGDRQLAGLGVTVVAVQGGGLAAAQFARCDQPPRLRAGRFPPSFVYVA
jgi:hypothetical protein